MARKGFPPIPIKLDRWHERHPPLARAIRTGDNWFYAWLSQNVTPLHRLEALTGIPQSRFEAIGRGDRVSRAEIDAPACAWSISTNDLIASIDGKCEIVD